MAPPDKITVAIRVRPITETGGHDVVTHDDSSSSLIIGADRSFTFDYIFSHNSDQISVYETLVLSLVKDCLQGINATVLAYGQTGSGKTYTMGTAYEFEGVELPPSAGIIPRAFMDLFKRIESMEDVEANVEAQFVELYNEELHDLLTPKKNIVKVQEKSGGGIYLSGATTITLHSAEEALAVLRSGGYSRSTASTRMNAQSSRSHAILTLLVNQKKKDETGLRVELISSKFHFVDLAGSERLGRTGAEGDRAKEGIKINYGLLALGNVINALSENQKHIPYRDSKLTRLLCDSLGGNSRTVLIACISPADIDLGESVNTLQYATRAKKIRNVISVNIDNLSSADAAILKKLMAENRRLRQQLKTRGAQSQALRPVSSSYAPSPRRGVTARPPLAPKIKESLIQLVRAFDKALNIRVKQMSAITGVAVTRYRKKLELSNLRLQYEVLRGCGDVKAYPMVNRLRALEKEVEDADSEISTLASALRRSGASIQDLQEKVARIVLSFPPCWRHIPQTARSLMSAQLADYESFGLQCYNNNLLHIIRLSETEHERGLSAVRQLNEIVGVSILRHFLPKLMNTVTADRSYAADAFDEGFKKEVPALAVMVASLFEGSSKTRTAAFSAGPTVKRSADPFMKTASNTRVKPRSAAMSRPSYVADRVPPLPSLAADNVSPPSTGLELTSPMAKLQCRTVSRPACPRQVLSPVPGLPPKMPIFGASPPRARKSYVSNPADPDAQQLVAERTVDPFTLKDREVLQSGAGLKTKVVWHNGLPLPVVDDFERENCCPPPPDTVLKNSPRQSLDTTTVRVDDPISAATSIAAALNLPPLCENHLSGSKRSMSSTVTDDGDKSPLKGRKKRFVLRQSTIDRFARCGIDFDSLAPH